MAASSTSFGGSVDTGGSTSGQATGPGFGILSGFKMHPVPLPPGDGLGGGTDDDTGTDDGTEKHGGEIPVDGLKGNDGLEPENIDKEFLRLWFVDNCDPYNDETLPEAPDELISELSSRYIYLYEKITGEPFPFPDSKELINDRINKKLKDV